MAVCCSFLWIGVGTKEVRPSLRTEWADFPRSALQLVVNFQEDRQATKWACFKEYKSIVVK
jgi:hypothetical protein